MDSYFDAYGERAVQLDNHTQIAGRYAAQRHNEKAIVNDLIKKLALDGHDHLIEIGCGTGNLLIPMSFLVEKATGIDHPNCIEKLTSRSMPENLNLVGFDFLKWTNEANDSYDKVVIYSVLHCLKDPTQVFQFVDKALALLAPGGRLLLGDIPNTDLKARFTGSQEGQAFALQWQDQLANSETAEVPFEQTFTTVEFNDDLVLDLLRHIRAQGYEAHLFPQPAHLPFGHTREDILVRKYR